MVDTIPLRETKRTGFRVIGSGIITSAATMVLLFLLSANVDDFNIMGWYAFLVFPVGALLVGLVSGSGYGISSWILGVRNSKRVFWVIAGIQVFVYFLAEYIQFSSQGIRYTSGEPVPFWTYYDIVVRSGVMKIGHGSNGFELGYLGYFFNAIEIVGFSAGGIIGCGLLAKKPYCLNCEKYMKSNVIAKIPLCLDPAIAKKEGLDTYDFERRNKEAFSVGMSLQTKLHDAIAGGHAGDFEELLKQASLRYSAFKKTPSWVQVINDCCPDCRNGSIRSQLAYYQDKALQIEELRSTTFTQEFFRGRVW
ncbi:MAG: hypothetical protein IPK50_17985 [Fibrobacterota bacterium]|nr:hypothetical protein [Fibrobacterota bacterium]QQS04161.1 MAG: hypothetical protein IPK50_17985 [Fibrobacterota bacterium]